MTAAAPAPDEPHRVLPGPTPEWLRRNLKGERNVEPSDKKFATSAKWGAIGIVCFAVVVVAFRWGPPAIGVDATDRWTGTDQIRFETQNNERIAKLERIIERMDALLLAQADTTKRVLTMMEKQDDRLKALEQWRNGERSK